MPGDDVTPPPESKRLTNRDRVPAKKAATARTKSKPSEVRVAAQEMVAVAASPVEQKWSAGSTLTRADLGSGRGYLFEWEMFVDQILQQLGGVGGPASQGFVHEQAVAAAVWTIPHFLNTKPSVLLVDSFGQQLLAEVHYPDDQTAVIVHGKPYSGSAYLRA